MASLPLHADRGLARRLERAEAQRLADYGLGFARLHPGSPAEVLEVAGGFACFTQAGSPLNRAAGLGMQGPVTEAELQQVEDLYRRHGADSCVELCPLAHSSLAELLGRRGYRVLRFVHVHFRPILPEDAQAPAAPAGLEVSLAGPDEAEPWAQVVAAGYDARETEPPSPFNLTLARIAAARESSRRYLARLRGEVVGAVALSVHDGIATLFSGATLPAFRGRGVHRALVSAGLREAQALGCELALAITALEGQALANVARDGFRVGYTRVLMGREVTEPWEEA